MNMVLVGVLVIQKCLAKTLSYARQLSNNILPSTLVWSLFETLEMDNRKSTLLRLGKSIR